MPRRRPRPRARPGVAWLLALAVSVGFAAGGAGDAGAADSTAQAPGRPPGTEVPPGDPAAAVHALRELGLENLAVDPARRSVAYENRRYRHSAEARGRAAARLGPSRAVPVTFFEYRLGLPVAAVVDTGAGVPYAVRYPSDREWPPPPAGPLAAPTWSTLDVEVTPLVTYEIGRILDPVQVRLEFEPRLRYNPWPGARATASLIVPVRNDFPTDPIYPDIDRVRPGPLTLEQFAWLPGRALLSGTVGIFRGNRYGLSVGAARPLSEGRFLVDAQADLTGYIAFPATGTEYSNLSLWTGFAGVTYRPPVLDLAVRARAQRFLYGDRGGELQFQRSMGDLDIAFFYQRTGGLNVTGVRFDVPVPPLTRPTGRRVRVLPVARLPLTYRAEAAPVGRVVGGVASREELLRQLSGPGLEANARRYGSAPAGHAHPAARGSADRVSFTGTTGFVFTPWCAAIADRAAEVGYNRIPRQAAYDHRGTHRNDVYYSTLGFLPRVEVGLRWTVIPGLKAFADEVPISRLTDSDRMLSGRLELLAPRPGRPGLAIGVEDAVGTRRFHSTYVVTGIPFTYRRLPSRMALGYAPRVMTASRHTLDGAFGAVQVTPWRPVAASLEYDTEKWNFALGIDLGVGFRVRAAMLGGSHASFGAGWSVALQ